MHLFSILCAETDPRRANEIFETKTQREYFEIHQCFQSWFSETHVPTCIAEIAVPRWQKKTGLRQRRATSESAFSKLYE